jgi:phospholipid/cholesterol/gamma-HCH transport system substrate-binding protein
MDDRVLSFRVGVVVVTAAIICMILILLFGAVPQVLTPTYTVRVKFPRAPGVAVNTPVRKSGVAIGRVSRVELLGDGGVLLTLRMDLDERKRVRMNEYPRISTGSIVTGDAVIEFVRDEADPRSDLLKHDDFLPNGVVAHDPFDVLINLEDRMAGAFVSIEDAATKASQILENLQWFGADRERFDRMLTKTESAIDTFGNAMTSIDRVVGDPELQQRLDDAFQNLPQIFDEAKLTLGDARRSFAEIERAANRADGVMANIEQFTRPLAERSERIFASIEGSAANLDELLAQLVHLSEGINQRQGTLGKLVYEDDIYLQLGETLGNIEDMTRRLRPILADVRVFTDKIARDPSQLGVRGALDRRPTGIKGALSFD